MSSSAPANVAQSQTDSVIIAGVPGKRILVTGGLISTSAATLVTFNSKPSGGPGVAISPPLTVGPSGFILPDNQDGWWATVAGEALTVTTGAGGSSGIMVKYRIVT